MKSLIALVPLCLALLSQSTPLGDRAIARRHKLTGVPLARGVALKSQFDAPASCASGIVPTSSDNTTITPPDAGNVTVTDTADNSTVTAPTGDNSTVTDDSDDTDDSEDTDDSDAPADNSTDTKDKDKRSFSLFQDFGGLSSHGLNDFDGLDGFGGFEEFGDSWLDLCLHSGGDIFSSESSPCIDFGFDGYTALLADADVCAQQEVAERMITFAKSSHVENSEELIHVALGYRRQARQVVEVFGFHPSTPYCHRRPIHSELFGVWNAQLEGVTLGLYGGPNYSIVRFGDDSSCPWGLSPDLDNCSCVENDEEVKDDTENDDTEEGADVDTEDVDTEDADTEDVDTEDSDSDDTAVVGADPATAPDASPADINADGDDTDAAADDADPAVVGADPATAPDASAAEINADKKARRGSGVWGR